MLHDVRVAGALEAVLLRPTSAVVAEVRRFDGALIDLDRSDLALLPVTLRLRRPLGDAGASAHRVPGFHVLTRSLAAWTATLSDMTPVAYVHLEFYAGVGFHAAIAWDRGKVVWGPSFTCNHPSERDMYYHLASPEDMAINGVLRWFGIRQGTAVDEFEAVGLARFRWTYEWEAAAARPPGHRQP